MKIRKILVPVDYSEQSERALRLACDLAARIDAVLVLVHVYQVPSDIYPYPLFLTDEVIDQIRDREAERMEAWCEKARAGGAMVTGHVTRGETHDEISAIARELDTDLIVIGTRERTGLGRALLGSTAERTVQLAPCPVLATH